MKHTVALGADPSGFKLKNAIKTAIENEGHTVLDLCADGPMEYSAAACAVSRAVQSGEADRGIAMCGTGMGVSIVCNKHRGVYAALCRDVWDAVRSVTINNTNVLCLGGMITGEYLGCKIASEWLNAEHTDGLTPERAAMAIEEAGRLRELENELY